MEIRHFESPYQLVTLIDFLPDSVFVVDVHGCVVAWNKAMEALTGVPAAEILGKGDREYALIFYGDRRSMLIDWALVDQCPLDGKLEGMRCEGEMLVAETSMLRVGANQLYLGGSAMALRNEQGEIIGAMELIRDITEHREMEDRRAVLYRVTEEISASIDRDQICAVMQSAAAQLMPVNAMVIALLLPGGREIENVYLFDGGQRWPAGQRYPIGRGLSSYVITTGQPLRIANMDEMREKLKLAPTHFGSDHRVISAVAVPLQFHGQVIGMLSVQSYVMNCYTLEDLKLLEMLAAYGAVAFENARLFEETRRRAEYLALLNQINLTIAAGLEMESALLKIYEQCRLMFDIDSFYIAFYDSRTGMIHFPLFRDGNQVVLMDDHQIDSRPGLTGEAIRGRKTLFIHDTFDPVEVELHQIIRSGGTPTRSYVGVPLILRDEVVGLISMQNRKPDVYSLDQVHLLELVATQAAVVVENARLYAEAREAQVAAEAANRAKSVFLANISHELRTPLNAILGFTQLMGHDANLTDSQRANLGTVGRSGEHLLALINDVLEMSKIEAGRMELQPEDFNLCELLLGLEEMFRLRTAIKGVALSFEFAPDVPAVIKTDAGKLRQILINLLGNAVKFTSTGAVILRVRRVPAMFEDQPDTLRLQFEVADTGMGIAADELELIFEAFAQSFSGRHSKDGTGLGLPISRQFVRMMGGELTAESEVGRGSVFRFTILVQLADANVVADRAARNRRRVIGVVPGQTAPDGGPYRLMVVDDVPFSNHLMMEILQPLGFEVRAVEDGYTCVELWESWRPHLIWMDIQMPVMDGYEATRRIKAAMAERPGAFPTVIVALTAAAFEEERSRILAEGCDDFVRKPFREVEIFEVLERHLGVQFIYADEMADEGTDGAENSAVLSPAFLLSALEGLSLEWKQRMRQAVLEGDLYWAQTLIEEIRDDRPQLAEGLAALVEGFDFAALTRLFS